MFKCKNLGVRTKGCLQKGMASGLKFNKIYHADVLRRYYHYQLAR
jgi:hypothetical protein